MAKGKAGTAGVVESQTLSEHAERLGARLKDIRKKKTLTITQLALYTGLSVGYLSNVERGQSSPTVENLSKICRELGVSITEVLSDQTRRQDRIDRDQARFFERPEAAMGIRVYDFGGGLDAFEVITIEAGCDKTDPEAMHSYPEMVYVTRGELTLTVDGEELTLMPGDAYCIRANHRHTLANRGLGLSESFWFRMTSTSVTNLV